MHQHTVIHVEQRWPSRYFYDHRPSGSDHTKQLRHGRFVLGGPFLDPPFDADLWDSYGKFYKSNEAEFVPMKHPEGGVVLGIGGPGNGKFGIGNGAVFTSQGLKRVETKSFRPFLFTPARRPSQRASIA